MKFIRTWGWVFGLVATVVSVGVYAYSIRALTSIATDVLSPANSRSETALTLDTKIYTLARTTREQRESIRAFFIQKSTLVRVFEYIEQIRKQTGAAIKVLGISESAPKAQKRVRKNTVVEDEGEERPVVTEDQVPVIPEPKGLGSVVVSLEVRGTHDVVMRLIELLELLPVVSNIQSVSVRTRDSGREGSNEWVGNVSLFLPTLSEPEEKK